MGRFGWRPEGKGVRRCKERKVGGRRERERGVEAATSPSSSSTPKQNAKSNCHLFLVNLDVFVLSFVMCESGNFILRKREPTISKPRPI